MKTTWIYQPLALAGWCMMTMAVHGAGDAAFDGVIDQEGLGRYYAGEGQPPPWKQAVDLLIGPDAGKSETAGRFLVGLTQQALADETAGTARWHATPFWGSEGENPARELRRYIAEAIFRHADQSSGNPSALVPVLEWFILKERVESLRLAAMAALVKLDGREADALVGVLAADETPIHGIAAMAIRGSNKRKLEVPEAALRAALADHHTDRRTAARDYWKERKESEVPVLFDPVEAIRSPRMQEFLERLGRLLLDSPSPDAPWVQVDQSSKYEIEGQPKEYVNSVRGWILSHEGNHLRILSLHGRILEFTLGKMPDEHRPGGTETTSFALQPAAAWVDEIAGLRANGDPKHQLSERGGLSGQFQGSVAGIPEMLVAVQLNRSNKPDLCARILFPALDSYAQDETFHEVVKDRLATIHAQRMLVAFIGERDYDKALAIAARIARDFEGTRFHREARRLLDELPKRRDDFRTLTLPTLKDWEEWRKGHSREEQIGFLCQRLRLMNCYQYGQPSDVDLFDVQFAEPCGLSIDASWGGGSGKTKVINPLVELLGSDNRKAGDDDDGEPVEKVAGMHLGIRDVPVIAPFLHDDALILAVGFWRDFHPSRTLTSTREILATVLEKAAKRVLVDPSEWAKLDAGDVARKIDEVVAWAKERRDRTEAELLLENLEDLTKQNKPWYMASDAAEELVQCGDRRAFPLIAGWLKHRDSESFEIREILLLLRKLDARQAKDMVVDHLESKDICVRVEAALILLAAGERERALPVIGAAFADANYSNMSDGDLAEFTGVVAKDNSPLAWAAIARLFDDAGIATVDNFDTVALCRELEARGNPAGLKHYRMLLDNRGTDIPQMVSWSRPIAHMFADKLLAGYAAHDAAAKAIQGDTKPDSEERLKATGQWLDERLRKLETPGK